NYSRAVDAYVNENYEEAFDYANKEIADNPKNGYAFLILADIRLNTEEYDRALTAVNEGLKYIPKADKEYRIWGLSIRVEIFCDLEEYDLALKDLDQMLKEDPNNAETYNYRAQIYFEQEKYDLSDANSRMLLSLDPGNVMGYMYLGRNANARGRYEEAIGHYNYAVKLASDYVSGYSFRAESYLALGKIDEAIDDIIKALEIGFDLKSILLMAEVAEIDFLKITSRLKVQMTKYPNGDIWPYCLGALYEQSGEYAKAIEYYKKEYSIQSDPSPLSNIASCYDELGDYSTALRYIDQAITLDPDNYNYVFTKADILYDADMPKEAIKEMNKYIERYPDYYFGYYRRGWNKEHSGDMNGAIEDYSIAISLNPDYPYAYMNRGVLFNLKGQKELAEKDFIEVIQRDAIPEECECAFYAYYYLGDKDKAVEFLNGMLSDNENADAYYEATCLYSIMGETEKSLEYLRKTLEAGYRSFAHIRRDRDLDLIRETEEFKRLISKYELKLQEELKELNEDANYEEVTAEIPFTKESGILKVACSINNLPLYFYFDTGAADVSMSIVEAAFMVKNGYLTQRDIGGSQYYQNATGEISEGTVVNLRDVEFGGVHLADVKASVVRNQNAPLLLGQSALQKLGSVEIDNVRQVLKITYHKPIGKDDSY
ncbi:MAG: tetratricopeptide repeat protein, partial [Oscillospiraceae bacterium]|nr:tetratricopeptide repeat protein [Oscillospiraceae bacterium]